MPVKKTKEQFTKEVYDLVGDEYTFLEDYVGSNTKIEVVHNTCGNKYEVKPNNFLYQGSRCPRCRSTRRWTDEIFKKKVKEELGGYVTLKDLDENDIQYIASDNGSSFSATKRQWDPYNPSAWENWVELAYLDDIGVGDVSVDEVISELDYYHKEWLDEIEGFVF